MRKIFWIVLCGLICILLAGCSGWRVRTSSSLKPRVDQEVSGNRGFISGKPSFGPKEPAFKERKVYKLELEMPQWSRKKKPAPAEKEVAIQPPKKDRVLWGNRGYIFGGPAKEETRVEKPIGVKVKEKMLQILKTKFGKTGEMRTYNTYKARKGDTLQKISYKFYGTTKKWPLLYKANKDKLKSPDAVYPGQVLVIPEPVEFKK